MGTGMSVEYCSVCGAELTDPQEDVHIPGEQERPDAHLKVISGSKGKRLQCRDTGKMTKVVPDPPSETSDQPEENQNETADSSSEDKDSNDSSGRSRSEPQPQPSNNRRQNQDQRSQEVYDIKEEKDAEDVLAEVVTNPMYGLNDSQVEEIRDWASIYDGQIPPNLLEDVASNMSGVANQTAKLMRQKYEAKLNRWVRDRTAGNDGPPIGQIPNPPQRSQRQRGSNTSRQRAMQQQSNGSSSNTTGDPEGERDQDRGRNRSRSEERESSSDDRTRPIRRRQDRAFERRNEVIDRVAEEAAPEVASEMASRVGTGYDILLTIIEAKARKDPDWFFEKAEQFDIDIIEEFAEPSQALQREQSDSGAAPSVDKELDRVAEEMNGSGTSQGEHDQPETEPEPTSEPAPSHGTDPKSEEQVSHQGPHWSEGRDGEVDEEIDQLIEEVNQSGD